MEGKISIVFVEKDKLYFSDGSGILVCNYPAGTVSDLELISPEQLKIAIAKFIFDNKLNPTTLLVIFSESVCFREDAEILEKENLEKRFSDFKLSVPFENILAKSYKTQNGTRFVAVNKDLSNLISEQFLSKGFDLGALVPASFLPGVSGKIALDEEIIKTAFSSIKTISEGDMGKDIGLVVPKVVGAEGQAITPKKSILPYLLIIFAVLLGILVFYLLTSI